MATATRKKRAPRKKAPAKQGRPTKHTEKMLTEILDMLCSGISLVQICRNEKYPKKSTIYRWVANDTPVGFRESYFSAREIGAWALADEIIDIADDGTNDWLQREVEDGRVVITVNSEHISRSRERIASRKWLASKYAPSVFGDRVDHKHDHEHTVLPPIKVIEVEYVDVTPAEG